MILLNIQDYLNHLFSIKRRLIVFNSFVEKGQIEFIEDISLKLRILFIRKSGTDPLFKSVQDLLGIELKVWVPESFEEELKRKNLSHLLSSVSFGIQNEVNFWFESGKYKINILEAFGRNNVLTIGEHKYSAKDIVEIMADRMGGAHIDPKLTIRDLMPHTKSIRFGNNSVSTHFIMSVSIQAIKAIDIIEKFVIKGEISDFITKN